jgi:hypothetical protein
LSPPDADDADADADANANADAYAAYGNKTASHPINPSIR